MCRAWSIVSIIDADEQITPYKQSVKDAALLEEERRLFYVAMTRAKDTLYILGSGVASRFLSEFTGASDSQKKSAASAIPEPLQNIPKYFAGKAVEHKRFGRGRVVRYEPGAIVVKFEKSNLTAEKTFAFPETFQSGAMWYL